MPKTEIDYSLGLIYKIVCDDITVTNIYVGSTTNFTKRKSQHKSLCNKKDLKIYHSINDNGGWDNWSMIEIEKYPCKDKRELESRERYWFELLNANLNSHAPFKTEDEKKEYRKSWREEDKKNNPEKIKEQNRIQHEKRKEINKKLYAIWWEKNKDIVKEKRRLKKEQQKTESI
jgi:hypothetical protein